MFSNTLGLQGTHQVPRFESLALTNVMWINRPSQLANDSPMTLADKLTESLRKNGDLELASPNLQRNEYVLLPSLRMRAKTTPLTSPSVKTWTKTAIRS